jgi:hypothetical protein
MDKDLILCMKIQITLLPQLPKRKCKKKRQEIVKKAKLFLQGLQTTGKPRSKL